MIKGGSRGFGHNDWKKIKVLEMEKLQMAPLAPGGEGNTKPPPEGPKRCSPSRKWCFTLFQDDLDLGSIGSVLKHYGLYIVGQETCPTTGTQHWQGYVEFTKKTRPMETFPKWKAHWEKAKGNREQNKAYCSKEGFFTSNFPEPVKPKDPMVGLTLKWWQELLVNELKEDADARKIIWMWEETGGVGKTQFSKHLHLAHNAAYVSGGAADIKFAIAGMNPKPKVIVFDIPRSKEEKYVSYTAMEEVKNGFFFSGKYESATVCFDPPHLIVFANFSPDVSQMSSDRWDIKYIGKETERDGDQGGGE